MTVLFLNQTHMSLSFQKTKKSLQQQVGDSGQLHCSVKHFWCRSDSTQPGWKKRISTMRHCSLLARILYSGSTDQSHMGGKKPSSWFLSGLHLICDAYKATKANRNPLNVYIAVLIQQLCNRKQEGKYDPSSKTISARERYNSEVRIGNRCGALGLRQYICVKICHQMYGGSCICVWVQNPRRAHVDSETVRTGCGEFRAALILHYARLQL